MGIIRRGWIALAACSLVFAGVFGTPAAQAATSLDVQIVACINKSRIDAGVKPLAINTGLASVARNWSGVMFSKLTMFHNPNLRTQFPAGWTLLGENVGKFAPVRPATYIHSAFMNSPAHKSNIVNPSFNAVGVGVTTANNRQWVTVDFARYKSVSGYVPPASLCVGSLPDVQPKIVDSPTSAPIKPKATPTPKASIARQATPKPGMKQTAPPPVTSPPATPPSVTSPPAPTPSHPTKPKVTLPKPHPTLSPATPFVPGYSDSLARIPQPDTGSGVIAASSPQPAEPIPAWVGLAVLDVILAGAVLAIVRFRCRGR